jgi:hypothetical protein
MSTLELARRNVAEARVALAWSLVALAIAQQSTQKAEADLVRFSRALARSER